MPDATVLGEFEHVVLLAILRLGDDAYGVTIRNEIKERLAANQHRVRFIRPWIVWKTRGCSHRVWAIQLHNAVAVQNDMSQ
jgi:hypothetical protein